MLLDSPGGTKRQRSEPAAPALMDTQEADPPEDTGEAEAKAPRVEEDAVTALLSRLGDVVREGAHWQGLVATLMEDAADNAAPDAQLDEVLDLADYTKDGYRLDELEAGISKEFKMLEDFGAHEIVHRPISELRKLGKDVVDTRWTFDQRPGIVRARLVRREYANTRRDDLYAATSDEMASRIVDIFALHHKYDEFLFDVSVAFLHATEAEEKEEALRLEGGEGEAHPVRK